MKEAFFNLVLKKLIFTHFHIRNKKNILIGLFGVQLLANKHYYFYQICCFRRMTRRKWDDILSSLNIHKCSFD